MSEHPEEGLLDGQVQDIEDDVVDLHGPVHQRPGAVELQQPNVSFNFVFGKRSSVRFRPWHQ
jgi:hypothetical protein